MNAAKTNFIPGAALMGAGAVIGGLALRLQASMPVELFGLGDVLAVVLIGWGGATLLWLWEKTIFRLAGPLLIFAGAVALMAALFYGSVAGAIAGGAVAIVGAILCLKK